jgi:hypothetical protein
MQLSAIFAGIAMLATQAQGLAVSQDPCAGCDESLAIKYQTCAMQHGDPCAELNSDGLVSDSPGTKKDVGCCLTKEKHDSCMTCKSMDCQFKTCNVNKQYYSERTLAHEAATNTKEARSAQDAAAMKAAGWGL